MANELTTEEYGTPADVRVKEYRNGHAVELLYGGKWINFHSLVFDFPDTYYFENLEAAKKVEGRIRKLLGK